MSITMSIRRGKSKSEELTQDKLSRVSEIDIHRGRKVTVLYERNLGRVNNIEVDSDRRVIG